MSSDRPKRPTITLKGKKPLEPAAAKPLAPKPAVPKSAVPKPVAPKPLAAKPLVAKPLGAKPAAARPAGPKAEASKAAKPPRSPKAKASKPKGPAYTPPTPGSKTQAQKAELAARAEIAARVNPDHCWCVWSPAGRAPRVMHPTLELAAAEAERLAAKYPGVEFHVMELRRIETRRNEAPTGSDSGV